MTKPVSENRRISERSLANLNRFQAGRSGNPAGRPKIAAEVRDLARQHGPHAFERIVELIDDPDPRIALMAAKEVLDRAYGRAPQHIDPDPQVAEPVKLIIVTGVPPRGGSDAEDGSDD